MAAPRAVPPVASSSTVRRRSSGAWKAGRAFASCPAVPSPSAIRARRLSGVITKNVGLPGLGRRIGRTARCHRRLLKCSLPCCQRAKPGKSRTLAPPRASSKPGRRYRIAGGLIKAFQKCVHRHTMRAMRHQTLDTDLGAAIWQRVIEFQGKLAPGAARALLKFGFSENDHALMNQLSAKARTGALTPDEQTELDTFERLGCLLDIVHAKARQALKRRRHACLELGSRVPGRQQP
jgi:hypothetical protein